MNQNFSTADKFQQFIEGNGLANTFKLNGPENLVIKNRAGDYRRADVMGDTAFYPVRCYFGKRNEIIVCFKPRYPQKWVTMEMTVNEAINGLTGFENYLGVFEATNERSENKMVEAITINPMEDPVFASW